MTWRRFLALVRGLSVNASSVVIASQRIRSGDAQDGSPALSTPEAAEQAFVALFGPQAKATSPTE